MQGNTLRQFALWHHFSLAPTSSNTILVLNAQHLKLDGYFPLFFKDYELDQNFELSFSSFKLMFQCMLHLSASRPSGMVFKHLQNCFHLEDSVSGFL
jgi:hypothetical protein